MNFEYYLYKFLEKMALFLPKKLFIRIFGNLGYLLDKKRKKVILVNKKLSGLDIDVKQIYLNFARNIYEMMENKKLSKENINQKVVLEGFENLPEQVIFVTAHFGNWEILPLACGDLKNGLSIVGRKLDNELLDREINEVRSRFGINVYDRKGALKNLIKDLKKGLSIGLLVDQNTAKNEGIETTFFGKRVLQTSSASILSKKFNIPIVMVFSEPFGEKWKIKVVDIFLEDDIQKSVDRESKIIEEEVKKFPNEYYWFHRRFKHFYEEEYA